MARSDPNEDQVAPTAPAIPSIDAVGVANGWALAGGVFFPLFVIAFALGTRMLAGSTFDPLPTLGHLALTLFVPAGNLLLWRALRRAERPPAFVVVAAAAALPIAFAYTIFLLPMAPFGLLGLIVFGLGLAAFGPAIALGYNLRMLRVLRRTQPHSPTRTALLGVALGALALIAVDLPLTATRVAVDRTAGGPREASRAVALVRAIGSRAALLRYGDEATAQAGGLLSGVFAWPGFIGLNDDEDARVDTNDARALYFLWTGEAYETATPRAGLLGRGRFWFDADQGGTEAGGKVPGLTLASSRIEGTLSGRDAVGYVEWTMEFANAAEQPGEARMTVALPPGAVAARATLWVTGEPREAVFAGRGAARQAYEQVVVRERRDPLLVTTKGADRLMVQAFPVPAGGTLKLRLGITAPLEIDAGRRASMALPAIVESSFAPDPALRHRLWIDGATRASPMRVSLDDGTLARTRPRVFAAEPAAVGEVAIALSDAGGRPGAIVQQIAPAAATPPGATMIVVDGSVAGRAIADGVRASLSAVPAGASVGVVIAAEQPIVIAPAHWSPRHRARVEAALAADAFEGGFDNRPALVAAVEALAGRPDEMLLWLHGPQPVGFRADGRLEQLVERSAVLPQLVLYQATPGPNRLLGDDRWFWNARSLPASGDVAADIRGAFDARWERRPPWVVERSLVVTAPGVPTASRHLVQLWAATRVAALAGASGPARAEALRIAVAHRIVTPVSGAVVLETDVDYQRAGLVTAVPEPGPLLILAGAIGTLMWGRRGRGRRTPL